MAIGVASPVVTVAVVEDSPVAEDEAVVVLEVLQALINLPCLKVPPIPFWCANNLLEALLDHP